MATSTSWGPPARQVCSIRVGLVAERQWEEHRTAEPGVSPALSLAGALPEPEPERTVQPHTTEPKAAPVSSWSDGEHVNENLCTHTRRRCFGTLEDCF